MARVTTRQNKVKFIGLDLEVNSLEVQREFMRKLEVKMNLRTTLKKNGGKILTVKDNLRSHTMRINNFVSLEIFLILLLN